MNPFQYASPVKLEDAFSLLSQQWGETSLLAGGTDLVASLKQGLSAPKRVVSLKAVSGLKGIAVSADHAHLGAMTTLAEIVEHDALCKHFPALARATRAIGSPQIRAMATLGGDLCQRPRCWYYRQGFGLLGQLNGKPLIPEGDNRYHAVFGNQGPACFVSPSTLAPALITLGATTTISSPNGCTRQVKLSDFFRIPQSAEEREHVLQPNEIITRVSIPMAGLASATYEVRERAGFDWPLVTASVALASGAAARQVQIVLGHVAPTPWPVPKAAAVLDGKKIDVALAARAGEVAAGGATPLSKNGYKVQLIKAAVKRAILVAAGLMEA